MSDSFVTIHGRKYVSPGACSFGDYGGAGSVGLANIRSIVKSAGDSVHCASYNDFHRAADDESRAYESDETAEIRALVASDAPPLVFNLTGDYSSETVFILEDSELGVETLESLESYALLDEEESSNIELEWENEAWENYIRVDLERAAWPEDEPAGYDGMSDSDKFEAYRHAMEVKSEYPEPEYTGVYVRVERIAESYRETVESMLKGETLDSLRRAQWPSVYARQE
jgi:hypothetical protein